MSIDMIQSYDTRGRCNFFVRKQYIYKMCKSDPDVSTIRGEFKSHSVAAAVISLLSMEQWAREGEIYSLSMSHCGGTTTTSPKLNTSCLLLWNICLSRQAWHGDVPGRYGANRSRLATRSGQ